MLKYNNIFSYLDTYHLLATYVNLNVFGYPITRITTSLITIIILFILFLMAYLMCFVKKIILISFKLNIGMFQKKVQAQNGSTNIFTHELFKNLFYNKSLLFLILSIVIGFNFLNVHELLYSFDDQVYQSYANSLSGGITEDKKVFIEQQQKKFNHLSDEIQLLSKQLQNGEIDSDTYDIKTLQITDFSKKITGFQYAKGQYEYLLKLQNERNIDGHFISKIRSNFLFSQPSRDILMGLIYTLLLIICIGNLFCCEYSNNMINVIRNTKNGRSKLFFYKSIVAYLTSFILVLILYTPIYITLIVRYRMNDWSAPIQSIQQYFNFNIQLSVIQFIIVVLILQLISAFFMTTTIILLSQILKKQSLTILFGIIILAVPFIFSFVSTNIVQKNTPVAGFNLFQLFTQQNSVGFAAIYLIVIILFGIISGIIAKMKFCNLAINFK